METKLVLVDPKEFGLEVEQVTTIEQAFLPKIQEREALITIYEQLITSEITPELCKQAKDIRLKLVKVRTGISDIHKTQKAFFLAAGRFVDAWKNKETLPVEQMEEKLSEIENYYINIEKARKAQLQAERLLDVSKYTEYPANGLGDMEQQVYDAYLQGLKVAYDAKIEAERLAEVARVEAVMKEKLKIEREKILLPYWNFVDQYHKDDLSVLNTIEFSELLNSAKLLKEENEAEQIRIKAALEQKEKELAAEKAKAEAERKELEEKARKEREKAAKEKAALEAELKAKQQAEIDAIAKRNAEIIAEEKAKALAAKAPRKEKLIKWVDSFEISNFENDTLALDIISKFESFKKWAKSEIDKL